MMKKLKQFLCFHEFPKLEFETRNIAEDCQPVEKECSKCGKKKNVWVFDGVLATDYYTNQPKAYAFKLKSIWGLSVLTDLSACCIGCIQNISRNLKPMDQKNADLLEG